MKSLALFAALSVLGSAFALMHNNPNRTIVIDAGHGGMDTGAIYDDIKESDLNLSWAQILKEEAEEAGYNVVLIRESEEYIELSKRTEKANEFGKNDILISIHMGMASEQSDKSGVVISHKPGASKEEIEVAQRMEAFLDTLSEATVSEGNFYILNYSEIPAVLIEPGFMSNPDDLAKLKDDAYIHSFAELLIASLN